MNDVTELDFESLNFTKFMNKCKRSEIIVETPLWLVAKRSSDSKKHKLDPPTNGGGKEDPPTNGGGKNGKKQKTSEDRFGKIVTSMIPNKDRLKLTNGDYKKVFGFKNRSGVTQCKLDNNSNVCNRFLALGSCSEKCHLNKSHVDKLSTAEEKRWITFRDELETKARKN